MTHTVWIGVRVLDDGTDEWLWGVAVDGTGVPMAHRSREELDAQLALCRRATGWTVKSVRFVRGSDD